MKKFLPLMFLCFLLGNIQLIYSQAGFSESFDGTLNQDVWEDRAGYDLEIENNLLHVDVEKKDQGEYFRFFPENAIDISNNAVINFKLKADKAIILTIESLLGTSTYEHKLKIPKSDSLISFSLYYDNLDESADLTAVKNLKFYVNQTSVSYNGTLWIDDFVLGGNAVRHANIGGQPNLNYYNGTKNIQVLFKGITNADSITATGGDGYIENLSFSPIIETTFTNTAYMTFDTKVGVSGETTINVTAHGIEMYEDHTIPIYLQVVSNHAPTIDPVSNDEAKVSAVSTVSFSGISDGDNAVEQQLILSASSSNQAVIKDEDIEISYKNGSPYGTLNYTPQAAGSSDITLTVDDQAGENNTTSVSFTVDAYDNLNLPPTIDELDKQFPVVDGIEKTVTLTGISDGNTQNQALSFAATSSDQTVIADASLSVSGFDAGTGEALLSYTPISAGTSTLTVTVTDDAAGTDNEAKSTQIDIEISALPVYAEGHDWSLTQQVDRWGPDSEIEVTKTTFDGSEVLEVTATDKWIWAALNFSFSDTSLNLTEYPYVSLEIYSVDNPTLHWLWFYDDYELTHDDAHRNNFPDVTHDEGKAVWAPANEWKTLTFDFSGENEMSRKVNDEPIPINAKRIVRILYNFHDQESSWPRPPEYSGTFYIRNMKIGNEAERPDPEATIDPVPDQITYENPGPQSITVTGLSDGEDGIPNLAIESLNTGFVDPAVSAVNPDGTAEITYDPGTTAGEAQIVLTASATGSVAVTDTFWIKSIAKEPVNAFGVNIDLSKRFQTLHGIGTFQNQYFDLYTQEMGATAMRVGIISNQIEPVNDNEDPYVLNRDALDYSAFNWESMRKMKEMGVETFILTSWSAPGWMKDNHDKSWFEPNVVKWENAPNRISPFYYEEWAEYFVAAYRMFEEEAGIQLAGVGIQNEPAFYEPYPSAILSPPEFAKMVVVLGKRFEEEGIDCKLFMPEQVFSQPQYSMAEYINAVQAHPEANKYTDVIATHGYASDGIGAGQPNFSSWTTMYNNAQEGDYPKELWMTETHKAYNSYEDAMWIATALYGAFEYGNINLWTQWGITGQHIIDGAPTQMLYTVGNFARYIKPGAERVESVSETSDLYTTSWIDEERGVLTTVAINDTEEPISAYLAGENIPQGFKMFLTTELLGCEYMGMSSDSLFLVPPKSVITLVSEGNQAPVIDQADDQLIAVDASEQILTLTGIDPVETAQSISNISVTTDNSTLISNVQVGTLQGDGSAQLTYQPAAGQSGTAEILVTVTDDGAAFVSNTSTMKFTVQVFDGINQPPHIDRIPDQYHKEDMTGTHSVAITATDGDDGSQSLTFSVSTENAQLIKNLAYNASSNSVEYELEPEIFGEAVIKVTATDDGGTSTNNGNQSAVREFKVKVAAVNDEPEINPVETVEVGMNAQEQTVTLEGINMGDTYGSQQDINVEATTTDLEFITSPVVEYFGGSTATVKFTPVRNQVGNATITVIVTDDGGVMNGGDDVNSIDIPIQIIATDINHAPTMDAIADQELYLSEGDITIDLQGVTDGDTDKDQTITITASSSNTNVVEDPVVNWVPSLNAGSIKLTPVQTGTVTVTVTLTDDGGTDFGGQNTAEYTFAAEVSETVNVEDNFANEINIYPNPSEDIFHIAVPAELADYEIRVTDQSGKILLRNRIQKQDDEHRLNLSGYQSGVYFITLISETNSYKKIIIKK